MLQGTILVASLLGYEQVARIDKLPDDWKGEKESGLPARMAVHSLLKKYIDSFRTKLERVPLKYDSIVLSRSVDAR